MTNIVNRITRKYGFSINRYPDRGLQRRINLLKHFNIDLVLDVGASVGEYALTLRRVGYKHRIISFEPIKRSYSLLAKNSSKDDNWAVFNYALGDSNNAIEINISENFDSSSILKMNHVHVDANPKTGFISKEKITIKSLDSVFPTLHNQEKNVFLKIDTQGFEKHVLYGAIETLKKHIIGLQVELSIIPLYDGSTDYLNLIDYLCNLNFRLYGIEPGFFDKKSGRLLQFDGIFFKEK